MSGALEGPDGHCHDEDCVGVGVGVGAGVVLRGFNTTLLGQLNLRPTGILDLYFGTAGASVVVVLLLSSCAEGLFATLLSAGIGNRADSCSSSR